MKQFLLLMLTFVFASQSMAQTIYECPHVKDGKTMQLSIPVGFYELTDMSNLRNAVYSTEESIDLSAENIEDLPIGLLSISYMPITEDNLESLEEEINGEINSDNAELVVWQTPEIIQYKGHRALRAGFKGNLVDEEIDRMYLFVFEFGDFFVMTYYMSTVRLDDPMEYNDFEKIWNTWKEVATEKEDGFKGMDEDLEDYSIYYPNDLFETKITYYDVLPDFDGGWNDVMDESGHLLSKFSYKENNGSVKVFSGGSASNYPSEEEMATAIGQAMDETKPLTLAFKSQFSNEDHVFQLYTIKGGGTMSSVYTTVVAEELVFFVVDGGSNPLDDFKPAVRDFMLTMWVDYFVEEEEE